MKKIFYARQWIDKHDIQAVNRILRSNYLTQGPTVEAFEEAVASYCGAKYAVSVNSGTSALHIACLAAGLGKGDEAITSPVTFVASANCILYCSAKPVFADIDKETVCMDQGEVAKKVSFRTRVIIPVHFGGHPCDMDEIHKIAQRKNITVIEDATHAIGSEFKGSKVGSCKYSDMTVFSFHAVKHITTGEGGMVLTNDAKLYQKMILLRTHGIVKSSKLLKQNDGPWYYEMQQLGFNYRLTDIQSALGISQLKKLPSFIKKRKKIVEAYDSIFSRLEGITPLKQRQYVNSSYHLYVIRFDARKISIPKKAIFEEYKKKGIFVNTHYIPVYYHPYYMRMGYIKGLCPEAENYYNEAVTLPLYPGLSKLEIARVIRTTEHIVRKYSKNTLML